ncbi:uncharacterized protein [Mobula birostris]|uniref:uncharacterized protein n=1 Tax=Mobula birostris TaxID=1983395 RepID=UPI003B28AAF4
MDPVHTSILQQALASQGSLLGLHDQLLREAMENLRSLFADVTKIGDQADRVSTHFTPSTSGTLSNQPRQHVVATPYVSATPPPREPHVPEPEHYAGDLGKCRGFLLQCSLVFEQQSSTYSTDKSKIAYIMGLLRGSVLAWATAVWDNQPEIYSSFATFVAELRKIFDHPVRGKDTAKGLLNLYQGSRSVAEYSVEFWTLAANSGWNDEALRGVYRNGLSDMVKDELAATDDTDSLDSLISLATRLDNRLQERHRETTGCPPPLTTPRHSFPSPARTSLSRPGPRVARSPAVSTAQGEEPMQLGRNRLFPAERLESESGLQEHIHHVRQVLQRLWENKLFVKAEKCEFHVPSVRFLGYIIGSRQVRVDSEMIRAVAEWPKHTTLKQLQRFLGFANFYRRFIRDYSRVAAPLTRLTSPATPFHWTPEADSAFSELKRRFTSAPILVQPDPPRQFIVEVDASDSRVEAVLSQCSGLDQNLHPYAAFSRRLSPAPTER